MIRLYVEAPLAAGSGIPATQVQTHYLKNVMRRAAGDEVALFNGRDGEWRARIGALDRNGATLTVADRLRPQAQEGGPTLLVAVLKRAPMEWLVEKATELGVRAIQPVVTRRTNVERLNLARLAAIAVEAAEQCERLTVPELRAPAPLSDVLRDWPAAVRLFALDETGGGVPIAAALGDHPRGASSAVLVGPEGGFEHTELDALEKLNFVTAIGLGDRILRAETAALAALACFQALAGDWEGTRGAGRRAG